MSEAGSTENKCIFRKPLQAATLSFLCPGLGQAYNGQKRKGSLFFSAFIFWASIFIIFATNVAHWRFPTLEFIIYRILPGLGCFRGTAGETSFFASLIAELQKIILFAIWMLNIVDAYRSAGKINSRKIVVDEIPEKTTTHFSLMLIRDVIIAAIIVFVAYMALMRPIMHDMFRGWGNGSF